MWRNTPPLFEKVQNVDFNGSTYVSKYSQLCSQLFTYNVMSTPSHPLGFSIYKTIIFTQAIKAEWCIYA